MIIYVGDPKLGALAYIQSIAHQVKYSYEKGYIPIVDMKNYRSAIAPIHYKKNAWELYFMQPSGYSMEDIRNARYVKYISEKEIREAMRINLDKRDIESYIKYTSEISKCIEKEIDNVLKGEEKVLGVIARGTDYLLPVNGMRHVDIDYFLGIVEHIKNEQGYSKIFLATEDSSFLEKFISKFENVLYIKDWRTTIENERYQFVSDKWINEGVDIYEKNKNYIIAVNVLRQLDSIVSNAECNAAEFAIKYNINNRMKISKIYTEA